MPRMLTDYEWAFFLSEIDIDRLDLPAWGGVVDWRDNKILVFIDANGEPRLTDVSDLEEFIVTFQKEYNAFANIWVYHLPVETGRRIAEILSDPHGELLEPLARAIGETAKTLTRPLTEPLVWPLAFVALGYLVLTRR